MTQLEKNTGVIHLLRSVQDEETMFFQTKVVVLRNYQICYFIEDLDC